MNENTLIHRYIKIFEEENKKKQREYEREMTLLRNKQVPNRFPLNDDPTSDVYLERSDFAKYNRLLKKHETDQKRFDKSLGNYLDVLNGLKEYSNRLQGNDPFPPGIENLTLDGSQINTDIISSYNEMLTELSYVVAKKMKKEASDNLNKLKRDVNKLVPDKMSADEYIQKFAELNNELSKLVELNDNPLNKNKTNQKADFKFYQTLNEYIENNYKKQIEEFENELNQEPTVKDPMPQPTPDPVVDPQQVLSPDPVIDPLPVSTPDPVVEPQQVSTPDPVIDPQPVSIPDQVETIGDFEKPEVVRNKHYANLTLLGKASFWVTAGVMIVGGAAIVVSMPNIAVPALTMLLGYNLYRRTIPGKIKPKDTMKNLYSGVKASIKSVFGLDKLAYVKVEGHPETERKFDETGNIITKPGDDQIDPIDFINQTIANEKQNKVKEEGIDPIHFINQTVDENKKIKAEVEKIQNKPITPTPEPKQEKVDPLKAFVNTNDLPKSNELNKYKEKLIRQEELQSRVKPLSREETSEKFDEFRQANATGRNWNIGLNLKEVKTTLFSLNMLADMYEEIPETFKEENTLYHLNLGEDGSIESYISGSHIKALTEFRNENKENIEAMAVDPTNLARAVTVDTYNISPLSSEQFSYNLIDSETNNVSRIVAFRQKEQTSGPKQK